VAPVGLGWRQDRSDVFTRGTVRLVVQWRYVEHEGWTGGIARATVNGRRTPYHQPAFSAVTEILTAQPAQPEETR
jgi:hypothetical protein